MSQSVTVNFLSQFGAAWNKHDVEGIVLMMTPDAVMFMSAGSSADGRRVNGRSELRAAIADLFATMPNGETRPTSLLATVVSASGRSPHHGPMAARLKQSDAMCSRSATDASQLKIHIESSPRSNLRSVPVPTSSRRHTRCGVGSTVGQSAPTRDASADTATSTTLAETPSTPEAANDQPDHLEIVDILRGDTFTD